MGMLYSTYLGSGKGFSSTEVIRLLKYEREYNGSNASLKIKTTSESAKFNPIKRIIKVIIIVIFTFLRNELNKVTKLLNAITYNTEKPRE
jgi:hypothetical protein